MREIQNFNFRLYGDEAKPKLVFLHGLMGYAQNWRSVVRAFEKDYHILTYDQRGHGKSFHAQDSYSPENYAEDLRFLLDHLGWQKVILVGHSMGGRNALHFTYRYPDRVKALVIEDIGPEANRDGIERIENILANIGGPFETKEAAKNQIFSLYDPVLANYLFANMEEKPDGKVDWRFDKRGILESLYYGRERSRWEEVESLRCPCLVIRGGNSEDLSEEVLQKMLASNPRIKAHTIEGVGHWVHFEALEEFNRVLGAFLQLPQ